MSEITKFSLYSYFPASDVRNQSQRNLNYFSTTHAFVGRRTFIPGVHAQGRRESELDSGVLQSGSDNAAKSVRIFWPTHLLHYDSVSSAVKLRYWMIPQGPLVL